MEQDGWDIFILDEEHPVREDGWYRWDNEIPMAAAHAAKLTRPTEALGSTAASAARALTLDDPDALDCGVCFHPLKPPIFQVIP